MKIDSFTIGRFELRKEGAVIKYFMDGEQIQYVEYAHDSPERLMMDILQEMFDRENHDNGLKWEE